MATLKLRLSKTGRGEVLIDDHPIPNVRSVAVEAGAMDVTKATIELIAVDIDGEFEVEYTETTS